MLINWLLFVCIWYLSIVYLTGVSLLFSVFSFSSGGKMTPNDDEVFPQIGAQTFLPSFQLNSETLKTFCTRNHQLGLRLLSRGASSSASVHTLFLLYLQLLFVSLSLLLFFKVWQSSTEARSDAQNRRFSYEIMMMVKPFWPFTWRPWKMDVLFGTNLTHR